MRLDRDPGEMSTEERRLELREILACGVVRAMLISGTRGADFCQPALTATAVQSDECAPRTIGVNTPR